MKRREFIRVAGGAALACAAGGALRGAERRRRPPNIVFIMADDLGYGHLGCYGQKIIATPHIDRLASEGMRFTQAYAGCSVCAPCRSVLMTGLHMGHTPVRANSGGVPLRTEDVTVAEVLKGAGYATGCFGKWGLGDAGTDGVPRRQGFDEFFGYLHQVHAHFYYPEYLWENEDRYPLPGNREGKRGQYSHDEILARALRFIRSHREGPFFCYVPVTIPHVELIVPEEPLARYRGRFEETPFADPRPGYAAPEEPKATLAAMITHLDGGVGRIVGLLKEIGIEEETVVFFTSDNGTQRGYGTNPEFFGARGGLRSYKGSMYEGGLRVPMIARWPGTIAGGSVNHHPWYFADVMATLAELAGTRAPEGTDGLSVVPALIGEAAAGRRLETHEHMYWELGSGPRLAQAVRAGNWKAVRTRAGAPLELYDLGEDAGETTDAAARHADVVGAIEKYLETCRTPPPPQIEPEKPEGARYR